ncbi:ubiquinone biosynthesis O-methyltransferase, partial [Coprinellus micaceus]
MYSTSRRALTRFSAQLRQRRAIRTSATSATVNDAEISHFSRLSSEWWDEGGEFSFLHRMNPVRVKFIQDKLVEVARDEAADGGESIQEGSVLRGLNVLDVGCGGGLLSESLARLGAKTVGIDASGSNIAIASLHASADPSFRLTSSSLPSASQPSTTAQNSLTYLHTTTDALLSPEPLPDSPLPPSIPRQFDVVTALEVLEHVSNPSHFLDTCASLVKPGGHLFISTMARTPLAYGLTILFAEHISGKVTKGTHTWSKYVNPEELVDFFKTYPTTETSPGRRWIEPSANSYIPRHQAEVKGLIYNPLKGAWHLGPRNSIAAAQCNYIFW